MRSVSSLTSLPGLLALASVDTRLGRAHNLGGATGLPDVFARRGDVPALGCNAGNALATWATSRSHSRSGLQHEVDEIVELGLHKVGRNIVQFKLAHEGSHGVYADRTHFA